MGGLRPSMGGRFRRLIVALGLVLALGATVGVATGKADPAPEQWVPTGADLVRTVRPCPIQISAPTPPVCWSMSEDTSAWMAQPSGGPYPWAQCTYYVGVMRPDIWNDRAPPSVDSLNDWDAWTWVEHAQAEGLSVDGNPQPGDVMVYSRAALGNSTGHVTIVDSVGGPDPRTGDEIVTVSEMNVEGLDDASHGQGDTTTLLLPRSELVPGLIQFIHKPGAGYTPPAWPAGWGDGSGSAPPPQQDPSLAAALSGNRIEAVTQSPAPLQAAVTDTSSGRTVKLVTIPANRATTLALPDGTYKVCLTQSAAAGYSSAQACMTGTVAGPAPNTIQLGHPRRAGSAIRLPVVVGAQVSGRAVTASAGFSASARISVTTARRGRHGRLVRTTTTYRTTVRLRTGSQTVRLRLPRGLRLTAGATVKVQIATSDTIAAHAAAKLG